MHSVQSNHISQLVYQQRWFGSLPLFPMQGAKAVSTCEPDRRMLYLIQQISKIPFISVTVF